jgi:hypothetical protein
MFPDRNFVVACLLLAAYGVVVTIVYLHAPH